MTTAAEDKLDAPPSEPPAKRRRGGRRSMNPDISQEERKRLRVLKNRESAMRSLAKKAEYSAKLEAEEKEVVSDYKLKCEGLERLLDTAIGLRTALDKVPEQVPKLIADAEACINKATIVLADDDNQPQQHSASQSAPPDSAPDAAINGEEKEVK